MKCVGLYPAPGGRVEVRYAGEYVGRFDSEALAKQALAKKRKMSASALPKQSEEESKSKRQRQSKSKFLCVHPAPAGKWKAHVNGKYLGDFESEQLAANAVKEERGHVVQRAKGERTDGEHASKRFKVLHDAFKHWMPKDYDTHMRIRRRPVLTL